MMKKEAEGAGNTLRPNITSLVRSKAMSDEHSISQQSVAYSYIRFSHPEQAKGDSLRRQTEAASEWCDRNKVHLDTSLTLHDKGCSAWRGLHRENPDKHALALFLKLVENDRVRPGSYLLIENLDRLSREEEVPACHLLTGILMAGVRVVQLKPSELILTEKSNGWELMRAVMELSRGHGESVIKSERVGKAWREKKRRGRENGELITRRLPAWVELHDGKPCLIPERAAVVRRIFELCIAGYGFTAIVAKFTKEGVPAFGEYKINEGRKRSQFSGKWNRIYIATILKDRRALGEFQPLHTVKVKVKEKIEEGGKTKTVEVEKWVERPDGPPIKGYFPAVVSEETWLAARAATEQRHRKPGRAAKHINVFANLLKDARTGGSYYVATRGPRREKYKRVLINTNGAEGREPLFSFPFPTFEDAVLALLREVKPKEILEGVNGHDEVMVLEGELARLESDIASIIADLDAHGESPALYARLRAKEGRKAEVVGQLAAARQKAANPLSTAWGEAQSLLNVLESAPDPDDARLRLRAALRRIVESVWMLVVPRGKVRLCAAQILFEGGARRDYLIVHRGGNGGAVGKKEASWSAYSLASVATTCDLDLRRRDHVARLEKVLAAADLEPETRGRNNNIGTPE
jgi:DNA invertase Pin-like site-specific DNA recombinase